MNPVSKPTRGEKGPQLALSKGHDIIYVQIYIIKELICNCIHHILYFMSNAKKKKKIIYPPIQGLLSRKKLNE